MTVIQADKARQFRALHEAPDAFVVANVWDGGSARMMAGLRGVTVSMRRQAVVVAAIVRGGRRRVTGFTAGPLWRRGLRDIVLERVRPG